MHSGFVHSVKVPRLYKFAAKIVREVREKGGSLKSLIYEQRHPNVSALYALCLNTLQKEEQLEHLIKKSSLLENETRLDSWLAKILITELIWGKKALKSECKPVQTILSYEPKLREELSKIKDVEEHQIINKTVKKARYVRINTLLLPLIKGIRYFQEEGWSLLPNCQTYVDHLNAVKDLKQPNFMQDFHIPELLVFPPDTSFHDHPGYQNGEIVLQDKASCLPSFLLRPELGSAVLDMCAAPGMKTTHLAAIMRNTGKIYAVEIDERRYETLCEQVRITSASSVQALRKDALTLDAKDYPDIEYILVDPTCSGSGMLDRQIVHGKEKCDPKRLKQLQAFQVFLLRHALLNFPKVKKVVYSTCSINPEENEQVIDEILENVQDAYKLVPARKLLDQDWLNFSSRMYNCMDQCFYANPDVDLCNGFFVAVFERNFDVSLPEYKRKGATVVTSNNEKTVEEEKAEGANGTRKRKKRGKRKSANLETSKAEEVQEKEEMNESVVNLSSDSIKIVDFHEMKNSKEEASKNHGDETVGNEDGEPVKKKKKKKKDKNKSMILDEGHRLSLDSEELKRKKNKRKTL